MAIRVSQKKSKKKDSSRILGYALVALAGFILISNFLKPNTVGSEKNDTAMAYSSENSIQVPVPSFDIEQGDVIGNAEFVFVNYPRSALPKGVVLDFDLLGEERAKKRLFAKIPVVLEGARSVGKTNPIIQSIPEGMRAITLRVDATSSVEGWAGSGAVVDVLLVQSDKTTVVAEKVKILSAERSLDPVDSSSSPNIPSTVTVLVTQDQALAITTAIPRGTISFALRNNQDDSSWNDKTYTADRFGQASGVSGKKSINGFVTIGRGEQKEAFALSGDDWVRSDILPKGYFPSQSSK